MKSGTRFLGIDDASHEKFEDSSTYLIGVTYRGTDFIEDIRKQKINVDGKNSTEKIIELYRSTEASKIGCILLDGISFAGLNVADIQKISEETDTPVVAVTKNRPDREKFYEALKIVNNHEGFWELEDPEELELKDGKVYLQYAGTNIEEAKEAIKKSVIHGLTPEPIRVADIIGRII